MSIYSVLPAAVEDFGSGRGFAQQPCPDQAVTAVPSALHPVLAQAGPPLAEESCPDSSAASGDEPACLDWASGQGFAAVNPTAIDVYEIC